MSRRPHLTGLAIGAALVALGAAPSMADPGGPAIKYFQTANPVVGSILSDTSDNPTIRFNEQVTVTDPDGVCQVQTTYSGTGNTVYSFSGHTSPVKGKFQYTQMAGQTEFFDTQAVDCLQNDNQVDSNLITPNLDDDTSAQYSTGWSVVHNANASGGSFHQSSKVGATASYNEENSNMVAVVAGHTSNGGKIQLWVDNGPKTTVSLKGATTNRLIVWKSLALKNGTHTVHAKVVSGLVSLDAFIKMQ